MSDWRPKRFWTTAGVREEAGGFAVHLDARPVRTPARAPLVVPSRSLAEGIAAEWDAQGVVVAPDTMALTRTANSALDKVAGAQALIAADVAGYGASDLLCYRAEGPMELIARQATQWDPLLDWAREDLGAPLNVTQGVMPKAQPAQSLALLSARVAALDSFALAAFHDLVAISGSLVLALAVIDARLTANAAWHLSRLDEEWQIEQWGEDDEAMAQAARRAQAFRDAARFIALLRA